MTRGPHLETKASHWRLLEGFHHVFTSRDSKLANSGERITVGHQKFFGSALAGLGRA